jgi:hypothetical protein
LEAVLDEVDLTVVVIFFDLNVCMTFEGIGNWAEDRVIFRLGEKRFEKLEDGCGEGRHNMTKLRPVERAPLGQLTLIIWSRMREMWCSDGWCDAWTSFPFVSKFVDGLLPYWALWIRGAVSGTFTEGAFK